MKYALTFFLFLSLISTESFAREITSFKQSDALLSLTQFLFDSGEDLPESIKLSDKKYSIKNARKCMQVSAAVVLSDVEKSIKKVIRFYPDEEIPYEQALIDLEDYLDSAQYKKCFLEKHTQSTLVKTSYYFDSSDKIHLRLDTIIIKSE